MVELRQRVQREHGDRRDEVGRQPPLLWCESSQAINGSTTAIHAAQRHAVDPMRTARPTATTVTAMR